jgi:hypothetical protein
VRREPLRRLLDDSDYGEAETGREGFSQYSPSKFVELVCGINKGCTPDTVITRIEFTYLE